MCLTLEDGRGLHAPVGRDAELDLDIRSNERRIRASWKMAVQRVSVIVGGVPCVCAARRISVDALMPEKLVPRFGNPRNRQFGADLAERSTSQFSIFPQVEVTSASLSDATRTTQVSIRTRACDCPSVLVEPCSTNHDRNPL